MATYIWCEIVCSNCAMTCSGRHVSGYSLPRKDLKKEAKACGWIFQGNEAYCDKNCKKTYEERERT